MFARAKRFAPWATQPQYSCQPLRKIRTDSVIADMDLIGLRGIKRTNCKKLSHSTDCWTLRAQPTAHPLTVRMAGASSIKKQVPSLNPQGPSSISRFKGSTLDTCQNKCTNTAEIRFTSLTQVPQYPAKHHEKTAPSAASKMAATSGFFSRELNLLVTTWRVTEEVRYNQGAA